MSNTLDFKQKNLDGFKNIWEKLLVYKVYIIYDISLEKNIDFFHLLNDVLPEANNYKHLWEEKFIIKQTSKVVDHIHCSTSIELINKKDKKIRSNCSNSVLKTKTKKFKIVKSF